MILSSSSLCTTLSESTQISILSSLDSIINDVNKKLLSNIILVDSETLFSNHVLYVGITSTELVYYTAIDSLLGRLEDLMFRNNVVCFVRPRIFSFDFVKNVVNLIVEFD